MSQVERILRALRVESFRLMDEAEKAKRVWGESSPAYRAALAEARAMVRAYEIARDAK